MGSAGGEPRVLLNALKPMLGFAGDIQTKEVVRIIGMMKDTEKLMSRCIYLNVLKSTCEESFLHDNKKETVQVFLNSGGWGVLNKWLSESVKSENHAVLLELMDVFKMLPVTIELLKQGNTGKLVKSMTKFQHPCVKKNAAELMEKWYALVKKKHAKKPNVAVEKLQMDADEKSGKTSPPLGSQSKKLTSATDSEKIKKRVLNIKERFAIAKEKKLVSDSEKRLVSDSGGFIAALNIGAPIPKKRRIASEAKAPMSSDKSVKESVVLPEHEVSPVQPTNENDSSQEPATETVIPSPNTEVAIDQSSLAKKKGKKGLSITWAPDDRLVQIQFIEPRAIKNSGGSETFSKARQMELLFEKQSLAAAHTKEIELMEWNKLIAIDHTTLSAFIPGERSVEKGVQMERQKSIISTVFLFRHSIPDSPTEPDVSPIELIPKRDVVIIPQTYQEEKNYAQTSTESSTWNCPSSHSSTPSTSISVESSTQSVNRALEKLSNIIISASNVNQTTSAYTAKTKPNFLPFPQPPPPFPQHLHSPPPLPQQPLSLLEEMSLKHPVLGIPLTHLEKPLQNIDSTPNIGLTPPLQTLVQRPPLLMNLHEVNGARGTQVRGSRGRGHYGARYSYPVKNPPPTQNNVTSDKQYIEQRHNSYPPRGENQNRRPSFQQSRGGELHRGRGHMGKKHSQINRDLGNVNNGRLFENGENPHHGREIQMGRAGWVGY